MPNYDRNKMERYAKQCGVVLVGIVGLIWKSCQTSKSNNNSQKNTIKMQNEINKLNSDIDQLSSGVLSSWRNSAEIDRKKQRRDDIQKKLDKYE